MLILLEFSIATYSYFVLEGRRVVFLVEGLLVTGSRGSGRRLLGSGCGCRRSDCSGDSLGGEVAGGRRLGGPTAGAAPMAPSLLLQKLVVQRQAEMSELEPLSEMSLMSQASVFFSGLRISPRSTLVGKHSRSSAAGIEMSTFQMRSSY